MVVNCVLFDDGLPGAECRGTLNAVELCDGDPDGPGGELHVRAEGHVAGDRAVAVKWKFHV